jgi:hypothetical protein
MICGLRAKRGRWEATVLVAKRSARDEWGGVVWVTEACRVRELDIFLGWLDVGSDRVNLVGVNKLSS